MSRRSLALLAAIVLVAAGLAWLAARTDLVSEAIEDPNPVASTEAAPKSAPAVDLAAPGSNVAKPAAADERTVAEADAKAAKPDAFGDAIWVEGLVRYPSDTPRGERAFVHARGRKLGDAQEHRFEIDENGRFRAAFAPKTRKGWLRVEGRFLYTESSLEIDPTKPPESIVLEPKVGGCLRLTLVPSRLALPRASELSAARGNANGMTFSEGPPPQRQARNEPSALEFGGLDPGIEWYVRTYLTGFEMEELQSVRVEPGQVLERDVQVTLAARISGIVRDSKGAPVDGVALGVEVKRGDTTHHDSQGLVTKDGGKFSIQATVGKTTITARKNGYIEARSEAVELAEGSEKSDVVIVLDSGLGVAGVVRWPDGKPAANATVEALWDDPELVFRSFNGRGAPSTKAAEDGTFRLTGLESGTVSVRARAKPESGDGPKAGRPEWTAKVDEITAGTTGLELVLEEGSGLRGRVVDDRGAAVSGARVRTEPTGPTAGRRFASANVDDDGTFELVGVPDGAWEVVASTKGRESGRIAVAMPADAQRELTLVLPRPGKISGRVLSPDRTPCANATVQAMPRAEQPGRFFMGDDQNATRSDAEGKFTLEVAPGVMTIQATTPTTAASVGIERDVVPGQSVDGLELVLRRGGTIEGTVRDAQDRPLAGVTVHANTMGAQGYTPPATSAVDGSFRIERVTPGHVYLYAMGDNDAVNENKDLELADGEVAQVQLGGRGKGTLVVTGTVRGKEAIAGARVSFFAQRSGLDDVDRNRTAKTDANGHYEIVLAAPGNYWAGADPEGFAGVHRGVDISDAPGQVVDFDLASGRIAGRVVGPNGKPMSDVGIQLGPEGQREGSVAISQGWMNSSADGTFAFEGVQAGTYALSTYVSPTWGPRGSRKTLANVTLHGIELAQNGVREGLELRLTEGSTILAHVMTPDGRPAAGATVTWRNGQQGESASTDAMGVARLEGLSPGETTLFARAPQATLAREVVVNVRAGETSETTLHLVPGTPLVVRIFDKAGQLVGDPTRLAVSVTDAQGKQQQEDWEGSHAYNARRFGPLPDGEYEVRVLFGPKDVRNKVHVSGGAERECVVREPE